MSTLFEYAVEGDYRSPDCTTVAVTAELMEEAIDYYVECMTESERSATLSAYLYEKYYADITDPNVKHQHSEFYVSEIVDDYIKDTP